LNAVVEESPVTPVLSDAEAMAQAAELVGGESTGGWELQLERGGPNGEGRPKVTLANIKLIFTHAVGPHLFRKNEFTHREVYGMDTPWGGETGREINDTDLVLMKYWLATRFRMEPPVNLINEAVTKLTHENRFHPVRDYLARLEWDGIPRIDTWLKKYMNAKASEPYLSAISRKTLCAMIARVVNPGHQFDCVLILEGGQGVGKSTSIRKLASPEWFSDTHIEIKDKDAVLSMQGVWAIEFGELSSLKKSDVDQLKEFISRREDRIRVPYGHRTEIFPRQCIFIGTTNNSEYFQDLTGNRRFWPVEVGECDFNGIERDRDQLFAEARWYYDLGENLYLDDKEAAAGGRVEQEQRLIVDAWTEQLETFLDSLADQSPSERPFDPGCFSMLELFDVRGPFEGVRMTPAEQKRVGAALRK
jgi:putative DNA primase/helicase